MSILAPEKRAHVIDCLRAGKGIRETSRETGVNKTTVTNIDHDIGMPPRERGYRPKSLPTSSGTEFESFERRQQILAEERKKLVAKLEDEQNILRGRLTQIGMMLAKLNQEGEES